MYASVSVSPWLLSAGSNNSTLNFPMVPGRLVLARGARKIGGKSAEKWGPGSPGRAAGIYLWGSLCLRLPPRLRAPPQPEQGENWSRDTGRRRLRCGAGRWDGPTQQRRVSVVRTRSAPETAHFFTHSLSPLECTLRGQVRNGIGVHRALRLCSRRIEGVKCVVDNGCVTCHQMNLINIKTAMQHGIQWAKCTGLPQNQERLSEVRT
jgi:hypothetical protein